MLHIPSDWAIAVILFALLCLYSHYLTVVEAKRLGHRRGK